MVGREKTVAIASLLTGATVWGLIWYPYRILEAAGLGGVQASLLTYLVAFVLGVIAFQASLRTARFSWWLPAIALAAGGCNIGYVLAIMHGEVVRVLLLFYLSPLWTVLLSGILLKETLTREGAKVIALSLVGAVIMLWHPRLGFPWPGNPAEWIGLAAGISFALQNVLIRKTTALSIELKSIAVFGGVIGLGLILMPFEPASSVSGLDNSDWLILVAIGVVLLVANVTVQFGLMRLRANQASVIFLFELVVAAIASWVLAGEAMGPREWIGGAMIIMASVFSGKLEQKAASS